MFRVIAPETDLQFASLFSLRHRVLRAPWNQPVGSERDDHELTSVHAIITDENGVCIATGRLQFNSETEGQIRFMAVAPEFQGKQLGKMILDYLEREAKAQMRNRIVLQARENALGFYERLGYTIEEKTFLLFDAVQHYRMSKEL